VVIERELKSKFKKVKIYPIDFDQADYLLNNDVKLQFFNDVGYTLPEFGDGLNEVWAYSLPYLTGQAPTNVLQMF